LTFLKFVKLHFVLGLGKIDSIVSTSSLMDRNPDSQPANMVTVADVVAAVNGIVDKAMTTNNPEMFIDSVMALMKSKLASRVFERLVGQIERGEEIDMQYFEETDV